ncbi:MAG: hypothetical protein JRF56_12530 [Deltaproteobacteria bacterium]|jgi:hypothetical protein|nr:hypothetical protein [Deltaproteobacteria bacterium]
MTSPKPVTSYRAWFQSGYPAQDGYNLKGLQQLMIYREAGTRTRCLPVSSFNTGPPEKSFAR